ncbi:SRPBCC family protein [soil metagenome]
MRPMAKTRQHVGAEMPALFALLIDPDTYPQWLVGTKAMRAVDDDWPAVGSRFHHRVGVGPLTVDDATTIVEIDEPHRLVLHVRATMLIKATVRFCLRPDGEGTEIEMEEEPRHRVLGNLVRPVLDPVTHSRNAASLAKLADLAQRRAGTSGG